MDTLLNRGGFVRQHSRHQPTHEQLLQQDLFLLLWLRVPGNQSLRQASELDR